MDSYSILEYKIKCIIDSDYNYFLNKDNVVGIGFGYKTKNGFYTNDQCIQVFVSNKIPSNKLSCNNIIPCLYKGFPTDVVETGYFNVLSLKEKIRPVEGGYGMSIKSNTVFGSVGCLVTNGVLNFVLSTNHVMANFNELPIGTAIFQPAYIDGGKRGDVFATLYKFVPLRFIEGTHRPINFSDAAIGLLMEPNILSPEVALIGRLKAVKNPKVGEEVKKVGRTSGLTYGTVTTINAVVTTNIPNNRHCLFKDSIITTPLAEVGDSGSILTNKNNNALGLVYAGGNARTICCRLSTVLDQLGVHIVS